MFELDNPFSISQSSLVSDLKVSPSNGRTTKVSLPSQELALLLDTYVLFGMTFRCSLLSSFREQDNVLFDVPITRELMAVCQGSGKFWDFSPDFPCCAGAHRHKIRAGSSSNGSEVAECRFHSAQIQAELSSNDSQLKLRSAGLTPHIHAELF